MRLCAGNLPAQPQGPSISPPPMQLTTPPPSTLQSPPNQPTRSLPSHSVHLPDMPAADNSALLHAIDLPALTQEPSLTALIAPDASARAGTFTPPGAVAALSCVIPQLVRLIRQYLRCHAATCTVA